ncbi:unknown [[Mannheimia] succiniciproducens MBEL55E]|uniref:Uncharacterized protein n=1 Tax=Mannheimia succiniciproducens (strain KCTC 0769BP / MBEL55E) TaxID=221988 RepID=Q65TC7_MANSM|nr:unknown [[Mannheimia] succiniciproducens MBEL55E]
MQAGNPVLCNTTLFVKDPKPNSVLLRNLMMSFIFSHNK